MKKLSLSLSALGFALSAMSVHAQISIVPDSPVGWELITAMRGQCIANPTPIPGAALATRIAADSKASRSVKWQAFSNERHNVYTSAGAFVAQIALGRDHLNGHLSYRIYFAPMNVWTPVNFVDAPSDLCNIGGIVPPILPPIPVYNPSIRFACLPKWTPDAPYWIKLSKVQNGWEEIIPQIYPNGETNPNGVWANNGDNAVITGLLESNRDYHIIFGRGADVEEESIIRVDNIQIDLHIGAKTLYEHGDTRPIGCNLPKLH